MKIELRTPYKTKGGHSAIVLSEHSDEPMYQLRGSIFDANGTHERIAFWMSSGRYSSAHQSEFDIVEQVAAPTPAGEGG